MAADVGGGALDVKVFAAGRFGDSTTSPRASTEKIRTGCPCKRKRSERSGCGWRSIEKTRAFNASPSPQRYVSCPSKRPTSRNSAPAPVPPSPTHRYVQGVSRSAWLKGHGFRAQSKTPPPSTGGTSARRPNRCRSRRGCRQNVSFFHNSSLLPRDFFCPYCTEIGRIPQGGRPFFAGTRAPEEIFRKKIFRIPLTFRGRIVYS